MRFRYRLAATFFATALVGAVAHAAPVEVSVQLDGGMKVSDDPVTQLTATPASKEGKARSESILLSTLLAGYRLDLPEGELWRLSLTLDGAWAAEVVTAVGSESNTVRITLLPAVEVVGRISVRDGGLPGEVNLRFETAPVGRKNGEAGAVRRTSTSAQVSPEGHFTMSIPAGVHDLRLSSYGFVPEYRWGVEFPRGQEVDLGVTVFEPGASVSGWLTSAGPSAKTDQAKITLEAWASQPTRPGDGERIAALTQETHSDERGFFQLSGVAPGRYRLVARLAGFATSRIGPIDVPPAAETQLNDAIVLQRPVAFSVILQPAVDPWGRPWLVALEAIEGVGLAPREVGADGVWESAEVAPAHYRLRVVDADASQWVFQELSVAAGMPPLEIEVPVIPVEGTVRRGDEDLAADLWFGGRRRPQSVQISSDEDGAFVGFLPREGRWRLSLDLGAAQQDLDLPPVEVERGPSGIARVEVEIPDTHLEGEVVTRDGRPVPRAFVMATFVFRDRFDGGSQQTWTDADGRFVLDGFPPGEVWVEARKGDRRSGERPLQIEESREYPPLRLELAETRSFRGRVISEFGAVPGARVIAEPRNPSHPILRETTGPDGFFEITLNEGVGPIDLVVLPPGFAARMLPVASVEQKVPMEIPVDQLAGALHLTLPPLPFRAVLVHGGATTHVANLREWNQSSRKGAMVLPRMEPGDYRLCLAVHGLDAELCDQGTLVPGGELHLRSPSLDLEGLGLPGVSTEGPE